MSDHPANPIYDRLTRGSSWPTARAATWIGVGVGLGGLVVSLLPMHIPALQAVAVIPALILLGLATLVSIFGPMAGLVLAGGWMGRVVSAGDMSPTGRAGEEIEARCVAGVTRRLRLVRTISVGLLAAGLVGLAYMVGRRTLTSDFFDTSLTDLSYVWSGAALAAVVIIGAMAVFRLEWRWCICTGIWIGLWWGRRAWAAASAAAVILMAACVVAPIVVARLSQSLYTIPIILFQLGILAAPLLILGLVSRFARSESIWIVEGNVKQ